MTASEIFSQFLCRGCGHHGLSFDAARRHRGIRGKGPDAVVACRGGRAVTRDAKCALCGEEFHDLREDFQTGKLKKKRWRGGRIYKHKMDHIARGDKSEDFA